MGADLNWEKALEHQRWIYQVVGRHVPTDHTRRLDLWRDFYHECLLEVARSWYKYDPQKGAETTFVYWRCRRAITEAKDMLLSVTAHRAYDLRKDASPKKRALVQRALRCKHLSGVVRERRARCQNRRVEWSLVAPVVDVSSRMDAEVLCSLVRKLPPRERFVIEAHFCRGHTLEEIGKSQGITKERARQIQEKGVNRLVRMWHA